MKGKELEKYIKSYMADCVIERNSKDTLENKKGAFKRFLQFIGDNREFNLEVTRDYTLFLFDKKWKESSVATDIRKIKAFVRWMFKQKLIFDDWSVLIKLPSIPKNQLSVPRAEVAEQIILSGTTPERWNTHIKINNEGRDCLLLMLNTGLRVNEALRLEENDLHLETSGHEWFEVASKGKGGAKDKLPLLSSTVEILKRPRVGRNGKYFGVSEEALNHMLERGCKKLKESKITCHKLRHIFASENARGGMKPYVLKRLMRHTEITTTDEYYINLELDDLKNELERCYPLALKERTPEQTLEQLGNMVEQLKIDERQLKITIVKGQSITIEKLPGV